MKLADRYTPGSFDSYQDFMERFAIKIPPDFNFAYDVVDEMGRREGDRPALLWCDDSGAEARFSFAEICQEADRTAAAFVSLGIRKGDPVMLILKRRYEFWFCLLALHKIGAIAIPATHLLTTKDIVYRNTAADVKMIVAVADPTVIEHVEEAEPLSPTLREKVLVGGTKPGWKSYEQEISRNRGSFPRPTGKARAGNSDISLLYFTSGTTGMPKMVQHNFTYPLGHILTSSHWQNVQEGGLHFTVSDTGWAKAMWGKIYGQWLGGCAVLVYDYEKFVPKTLLEKIARHGVTSFCAPPTIYRFLIREDLAAYDLKALRYAVIAGEPLNPEVYHQFLKMTGLKLMEGYGQTECTVAVANYPGMEPKPGSMGKASPGYDLELLDEEGRSCEAGEVGQIVIRTEKRRPAGMFDGYYRDGPLTRQAWHHGRYYTGDTAWKDEEGYIWFVGRADDLIKSSGYRIGPFEVESALVEHPAVLECAVTGVPDPLRGQIVKASVVLTKGYTPSDELAAELQEHVRKATAPYKYPRLIEFVAELPKTISGKIRRVEIRGRDGEAGERP